MNLIVVPTDFSKPSKVATEYAVNFAKKAKVKVVLICVLSPGDSIKTASMAKLHDSNLKTAQKDAARLIGELQKKVGKVDIKFEPVESFDVVGEIERYAKSAKADLIVMGSKGASGLRKILFGSTAASVVENSSIPVVVVPEDVSSADIKKIVYATDAKNFKNEVKVIAQIARNINASMEVLHVIPPGGQPTMAGGVTREKLIELANYPKIHLHILQAKKVADGINDFVTEQKADLVAMFTHTLDFKEKILGKSVTREMAFHSTIPILSFNKKNLK